MSEEYEDVRRICTNCGVIDNPDVEDRCPSCNDEALDVDDPVDENFLREYFKQRRHSRWMTGAGIGFLVSWILLWEVLIIAGILTVAYMYSNWKKRQLPEPVQRAENYLFQQHRSDTWRLVLVTPLFLSMMLVVVAIAVGLGSGETAEQFAMEPAAVLNGEQWWTTVTYMFLHADVSHLVTNIIALLIFGAVIDLRLGHLKTAVGMVLAGIAGGLVHAIFTAQPETVVVGASAIVFGLAGANLVLVPKRPHLFVLGNLPLKIPTWLLVSVLVVVTTGVHIWLDHPVAWLAHLGGFGFGVIASLPLRSTPIPPVKKRLERRREERIAAL